MVQNKEKSNIMERARYLQKKIEIGLPLSDTEKRELVKIANESVDAYFTALGLKPLPFQKTIMKEFFDEIRAEGTKRPRPKQSMRRGAAYTWV